MGNVSVTNFTYPDATTAAKLLQRSLQISSTKGVQYFGPLLLPPRVQGFNPGYN